MANETVFVKILDKEYQVACPQAERQALMESAQLLDERMKTIRASGAVIGLERIAVMAALNLSHELLQARAKQTAPATSGVDKADFLRLSEKIDRVLAGH